MPIMNSNMFMILSEKKALIIDPCVNEEAEELLLKAEVDNITVILTHEHYDHISGVNRLRELMKKGNGKCTVIANAYSCEAVKIPEKNLSEFFFAIVIKRSEEEKKLAEELFQNDYACTADISFEGTYSYNWENIKLILVETPGHSPGSICIEMYDEREPEKLLALATGDSLVEGNKVITRLPGGDKKAYKEKIFKYLESFPGDTTVLPGHGEISLLKDLELG